MKLVILSKWQIEILKEAFALLEAEKGEGAMPLSNGAREAPTEKASLHRQPKEELSFAM